MLEEDSKFEPNLNSKTTEFKTTCEKGITINDNLKNNPKVIITYFEHDKTKDGGQYLSYTGYIKKIDMIKLNITLTDKTKININEIIDITEDIS